MRNHELGLTVLLIGWILYGIGVLIGGTAGSPFMGLACLCFIGSIVVRFIDL